GRIISMDLYRRKDGRSPFWYYDTTDPTTGMRVRKSTKETDKRKAMAKALEETERLGNPVQRETLAEASERYIERMKADGKASWASVEVICNKLFGKVRAAKDGKARFSLDPTMLLP